MMASFDLLEQLQLMIAMCWLMQVLQIQNQKTILYRGIKIYIEINK